MSIEAPALRLFGESRGQLRSLAEALTRFRLPARRTVSGDRCGAAPTARLITSPADDLPAAPFAVRRGRVHRSTSRSFVVFGTAEDRTVFTTVIRAFALAGRWGDRLTLVGSGRYRCRLEKWTRALRIDGVVSFVEPGSIDAESVVEHDIAILVSQQPSQAAILVHAMVDGLCVMATDQNAAAAKLFGSGRVGTLFQPRDVTALSHALLVVAEPDRAAVQRLLASFIAPDGSCAAAVDDKTRTPTDIAGSCSPL